MTQAHAVLRRAAPKVAVSVVIPAYNAALYIAETLASVHRQSLGVDEIIVVDDGSTDDTVAIARLNGAHVIEQKNQGVSVARNHGMHYAHNEWIAFLDADDVWESDKLERQWSALEAMPQAAFAFCDFSQFDDSRIRNASVLHEVHRHFECVGRTPLGNDAYSCDPPTLRAALMVQNVVQPSALLVRRDVALEIGGFDERLLACQDYDFIMRLTRDHVGSYVDLPLVGYRRHPEATTSNIRKSREGLANVALRVVSRSWEYSPDVVEHFRNTLPEVLLKCGLAHIRFGSSERARLWLLRSLRQRFTVRAAVLYAATFAAHPSRDVLHLISRLAKT
jgi:glycosyltransferase involved in cell wall biosynthesis